MKDRRSTAQRTFDLAAHGWAFCNRSALQAKIARLAKLSEALSESDPRHEQLKVMRAALLKEASE